MNKNCNEAEGVRLLETMRRICAATGCEEVEHATLAYEEALHRTRKHENGEKIIKQDTEQSCSYSQNDNF